MDPPKARTNTRHVVIVHEHPVINSKTPNRCWKSRPVNVHEKESSKRRVVFDDYDEYDFRSIRWDGDYKPVLPHRNYSSSQCCYPSSASLKSSTSRCSLPCPPSPRITTINKTEEEELFTDLEFRSHFLPSNDSDDSSVLYIDDDDHYFTLSESEDNHVYDFKKNHESESSDHSTMCETYATDSSTIVSSSDEDRDRANDKFCDSSGDSDNDECFLPPLMKNILDAFNGICNGGPPTPVMTGHHIELYVDENGRMQHSSIPGMLVME